MSKFRKRSIIYNDDAEARIFWGDSGIESFLASRFDWCKKYQVDSIFWCVGKGDESDWTRNVPDSMKEANAIMVDAARKADIEIFASLRMNDTHDAFAPEIIYPLKVKNPELLVATKKDYPDRSIAYYRGSPPPPVGLY